jgi:hypothetical protein
MPFPKNLLIEGETLVLDLRPHPIQLALPTLYTIVGHGCGRVPRKLDR